MTENIILVRPPGQVKEGGSWRNGYQANKKSWPGGFTGQWQCFLSSLRLAKEPEEIHTGKPMITITIDGQLQSVPEGSTVLDAARIAGIDIPTLCHIDGLEPYGGCRLC
ncbi:MAG: 2Fe-2S iron-sulfur cluster-binding protein, partial [Spirochaetia bacterium]|nr:2Fe-2S iron-sulfur cluster-binding protein [Spirochaetia bacterium]